MFLLRIIGSYFGEFLLYLLCKLKIKAILTLLRLINRKKTIYLKLRLRWKFSVIKFGGRSLSRRLKNSGLRRRLRYSVIQWWGLHWPPPIFGVLVGPWLFSSKRTCPTIYFDIPVSQTHSRVGRGSHVNCKFSWVVNCMKWILLNHCTKASFEKKLFSIDLW